MTTKDDNTLTDDGKTVEELLGHAAPRPIPRADAAAAARAAVQQEWHRLIRARSRRRRLTLFAAAASMVLAVAISMTTWLAPANQGVRVATLEKTIGTIYLLGERSELHEADKLEAVSSGQTIVTAGGAGVGLRWGSGGSLRLAENTKVHFASPDAIELVSGRAYFDSLPGAKPSPGLIIATEHGEVRHIGTQFITEVDRDALTVWVREGRVSVQGRFHDVIGMEGQQLRFAGSRRPEIVNIERFGADWEWVEAMAPSSAMEGKKLHEFLTWVSRETGLALKFETEAVEGLARRETVAGDISAAPRAALRQSMLTADLDYVIDDGEIRVGKPGR